MSLCSPDQRSFTPSACVVAQPAASFLDAPPLRVQALGVFAVWRGHELLSPSTFAQRKAALLFKALITAPNHRLHREQLLDTLWPDADDPDQAAHRLRSTLYRLRAALGAAYLPSSGDLLVLDPAPGAQPPAGWLDAAAFERDAKASLAARDLELARAALMRYTGDYLPEEPYADFADPRRTALRSLNQTLTLHTATLAPAPEAAHLLSTLLQAEPTHEEASLALMRLLAAQGRPADALRAYDTLAAALVEDLGLDPGPPLQSLRAQLLAPSPLDLSMPAPPLTRAEAPALAPLALASADTAPSPAVAVSALAAYVPLNTLPSPLTPFIGRQRELTVLLDTLVHTRLLTLTGSGGIGKTRLALELVRAAAPLYDDGVRFLDLAALADGALLPAALADALGLREEPGCPLLASLVAALRPRATLLLIDNAEHLVAAVAHLATALLENAPRLRILVTSRETLGLPGETLFQVSSLGLPHGDGPDPDDVAAAEAAQLFLARARAVCPPFTLDAASAPLVATVCRELDGIPLALELAAARLSVLALPQLVARLGDRFRLLTGGARTALPRHQTLRATMDWSYGLLAPHEQVLLRRLAVFAGGCTLDAAEAVCCDDLLNPQAVLDTLACLVSKSLVQVEGLGERTRYHLLGTVRTYAAEALAAADEAVRTEVRYADWALSLTEEAAHALCGPARDSWLVNLDDEHDNLHAALHVAQAYDSGDEPDSSRLAKSLWRCWRLREALCEGRKWLEGLLTCPGCAPSIAVMREATADSAAHGPNGIKDIDKLFASLSVGSLALS